MTGGIAPGNPSAPRAGDGTGTRPIDRRGAAALLMSPLLVRAAQADDSVTDSAGRRIVPPSPPARVFPANDAAAVFLYTLAPDILLGWPTAPDAAARGFLLPAAAAKPEVGRIVGRGDALHLTSLLAQRPDLIIAVGPTSRAHVALVERIQTETLLPCALIDGRFAGIAGSYRLLGRILGRAGRGAMLAAWCEQGMRTIASRVDSIAADQRPKVYFARGAKDSAAGAGAPPRIELLDYLGARTMPGPAPGATTGGQQAIDWNPDVILTDDPAIAAAMRADPAWAGVTAVRESRIHASPRLPFVWIDFPPSANRMIGLWWLAKKLYPEKCPEDMAAIARDFHALFYQVALNDEQIGRLLE